MDINKSIELEYRALLTQEAYTQLLEKLQKQATDLGKDDKSVWFFLLPDKLIKVTHNISQRNGKVTLKNNRIGNGSAFEEIEYAITEDAITAAVTVFESLGHPCMYEPSILRHNFEYQGVELAVKYSKSWGYHLELEILLGESDDKAAAEEKIHEVADSLDVHIMSETELQEFTQKLEAGL